MKPEKIDEQLKNNLFSANDAVVLSAIEAIKVKGNKLYIPVLLDLLNASPEPDIEQQVIELLGSVKDKEAVNSFIRAIEDSKYQKIRKSVLVACWENGLDFSTFLPVFIDVIINDDWETAFEAFTVVDNFEFIPPLEIIKTSKSKIQNALPLANEQKKYFLNEILKKISE